MAVRSICAPLLDLPRFADADAYVARRAELGADEVARRMLGDTGIAEYLVDTGFLPELLGSPEDLAGHTGARAREIVRLETVAEQVVTTHRSGRLRRRRPRRIAGACRDSRRFQVDLGVPGRARPRPGSAVGARGGARCRRAGRPGETRPPRRSHADPVPVLDGRRHRVAGAVPRRLRRLRRRPGALQPVAAHPVATRDGRSWRAGDAPAQLPLPPCRRLPRPGVRPRVRRRRAWLCTTWAPGPMHCSPSCWNWRRSGRCCTRATRSGCRSSTP